MSDRDFIVSWCSEGLESIVPLNKYLDLDRENTWRVLAGKPVERNPLNTIIQSMLMRARLNSQRSYEIYQIACDEELSEDDISRWFESSPDQARAAIRNRGYRMWGHDY